MAVGMAFAQMSVSGTVFDSETGEPVIGTSVIVKEAKKVFVPLSLPLFCQKTGNLIFFSKKPSKDFASSRKGRTFALAFRKGGAKIDL